MIYSNVRTDHSSAFGHKFLSDNQMKSFGFWHSTVHEFFFSIFRLHCDDSSMKALSESMVMAHSASSMPYILFYRRGDTMGSGSGVSLEKAKGSSAAGGSSNKIASQTT